jgi:hypothetical protein
VGGGALNDRLRLNAERRLRPRKRLPRVARFVAIVWSIAAAFWVLQEGTLALFSIGIKSKIIPDSMLLGPTGTDCTAAVRDVVPRQLDAEQWLRSRVAVWKLGFGVGFSRKIRELGVSPAVDGTADVEGLARELGVAAPELPAVQHVARALSEFTEYVRADPQCLAAVLSHTYSRQHGPLYQFAATVGYAYVIINTFPTVPDDGAFSPDLREYGSAAGIPESLWAPLVGNIAGLPPEDIRRRAVDVRANLFAYVGSNAPVRQPMR